MQAVQKYSEAIELCPTHIYLSNRAFCYVKLENFGLAIADADAALRCLLWVFTEPFGGSVS